MPCGLRGAGAGWLRCRMRSRRCSVKAAILAILAFAAPAENGSPTHAPAYENAVTASLPAKNAGAAGLVGQVIKETPERRLPAMLEIGSGYKVRAAQIAQPAEPLDRASDNLAASLALPEAGRGPSLRPKLDGISVPRVQLDVELTHSQVEGGQPNWREGSIQLGYKATASTTVSGTVEVSERFSLTDAYGEVRLNQKLSPGTSFYVAAGGTPNADFRPKWQIQAGGSVRVNGGPRATILTLDVRQARYNVGHVQSVAPGIEHYVAGGRAWVSGRWINVFDERGHHRSGWLGRGDLMLNDRLRIFAGAADAPDSSEGVVIETFSVFAGAVLEVSQKRVIRFTVAREDRHAAGNRLQLGLGLGLRF